MKTFKLIFKEQLELDKTEEKIINNLLSNFLEQYNEKRIYVEKFSSKLKIFDEEKLESVILLYIAYKVSMIESFKKYGLEEVIFKGDNSEELSPFLSKYERNYFIK